MLRGKSERDKVQQKTGYATADDFCEIFLREMDGFLRLAIMLTGSVDVAEGVVASALGDCRSAAVYKPWAESWSRLAVIERAIKAVRPTESYGTESFGSHAAAPAGVPQELEAVLRLDAFRRFVYVLTVLERYSVRDCAILLKSGKQAIAAARQRAITQVAAQQNEIFVAPETRRFTAALSA